MENRRKMPERESAEQRMERMKGTLAYTLSMVACAVIGALLLRIGLWTLFPELIGTPLPPFAYEVMDVLQQFKLPFGEEAKEIVDMIAAK